MNYIGIDPGKSGGIAIITPGGGAYAHKMPETDRDLLDLLSEFSADDNRAVLEQVHAMPGQGVTSTFTFGRGYGKLEMALCAALIPFETVTPQKWQKLMGCLTKGDKNVSKAAAQRLFPHLKVTHAIADALLIAEYCRRTSV
jgi:crossover junction endodeoxyribonuclease RuvC